MGFSRSVLEAINQGSSADEIDRAGVITIMNEADALSKQQSKRYRPLPAEFDGIHCEECGTKINPDRIKAMQYQIPIENNVRPHATDMPAKDKKQVIKHGTEMCILCAEDADHKRRQYQ